MNKKMLSILSGMAFVAALGAPAFALDDVEVTDVNAALAAGSNIAQDDSTATTDNSTTTTTTNTATATTNQDSNDDNSINDSFKVKLTDAFKQDNSIKDSGNLEDKSDNSINTDQSTKVKVEDSFKVTDSFNTDNSQDNDDNVIVEASLVMVSANVQAPVLALTGDDGGEYEIKNKIELNNAANDFSGISNINLSSGFFNNAASQVTFGIH